MNIRVGYGYDVHQLKEGEELWLGGIKLDSNKGIVAHSDGDVMIHAICDALLGAANMRDIGYHFPDTSSDFKKIDSKILLQRVNSLLKEKDYKIGNIDCTLCMEKPKIKPHIDKMQEILAEVLHISVDQISIKATTKEKLGFIGREEGVDCAAVVLIYK